MNSNTSFQKVVSFVIGCMLLECTQSQAPADYPTRVPGSCPDSEETQFDCGNGLCIPFSSVRNCVNDCADGSDEECGENMVLCDKQLSCDTVGCGKCVQIAEAHVLCKDRKLAKQCDEPGVVQCKNTANCILREWIGDGENDCGDSWDEDPCSNPRVRNPCGVRSDCVFDGCTLTTTCKCKTGFTGDGRTCVPIAANPFKMTTTVATTKPPVDATCSGVWVCTEDDSRAE